MKNFKNIFLFTTLFALINCASKEYTESFEGKQYKGSLKEELPADVQVVRVVTFPEAASCEFFREEEKYGEIDETPGNVALKRSHINLDVLCKKEGYKDRETKLFAHMLENQTQISGNIGSLISAVSNVTKAVRGTLSNYDESLTIYMDPLYFTSEEQKLDYIDQRSLPVIEKREEELSTCLLFCNRKKVNEKFDDLLAQIKENADEIPIK